MGLEVVTFISDLIAANPVGATDPKSAGDNHIRNIKAAILATFGAITGAVTASHTELNLMTGATGVTGTGNTVRSASPIFTGTLTAATVAATTVTGAGSGLTALNASNLASGTVPDARFPATLPAASAANLTAIPAANITGSHTLPDGVLSTNVPLLNASNTFTGATQAINATSANARLTLSSSTSGNAIVETTTARQQNWILGVDRSDSGKWKVSNATDFSVPRLIIDTSGNFDFKGGTITGSRLSSAEVGYICTPQNSQSVSYSLVLADMGKYIFQTGAVKRSQFPANASVAFPIGTVIVIEAAQTCTIAITSDTLYLAGTGYATTGSRTLATGGIATILKRDATSWLISGTGLS